VEPSRPLFPRFHDAIETELNFVPDFQAGPAIDPRPLSIRRFPIKFGQKIPKTNPKFRGRKETTSDLEGVKLKDRKIPKSTRRKQEQFSVFGNSNTSTFQQSSKAPTTLARRQYSTSTATRPVGLHPRLRKADRDEESSHRVTPASPERAAEEEQHVRPFQKASEEERTKA